MAVTADTVVVELEARMGQFEQRIQRAEQRFDKSMSAIRSDATKTEKVIVSAFRNIAGAAGVTLGAAGLVAAAAGFIKLADAAKTLDAQLKLATSQFGNYNRAQQDVRRIAIESRSSLEDTVKLYGNFIRNAKDLGISQDQAGRATETLAKTFILSGSTAAEASQGLRQLTQALQSGVLRGDEFNTMMESAPRMARLLADSLGVPIGKLREMAEAGQLTAQQLTKALTDAKFTAAIDAEMKQLPVTFDQAMTQIYNAAVITFGAFDEGGEFSKAISNFVAGSASDFADMEENARKLGVEVRAIFDGLDNAFDPFGDNAISIFGMISGLVANLHTDLLATLHEIDVIRNAPADIASWIARRTAEVPNAIVSAATGGRYGVKGMQFQGPSNLLNNQLEGEWESKRQAGFRDTLQIVRDAQLSQRDTSVAAGPGITPTAKGAKGKKGPSAETLAKRAQAAADAAARDEAAYQAELSRFRSDMLAANEALSNGLDMIVGLQIQQIDEETARAHAAVALDLKLRNIDETKQKALDLEIDNVAALKRQKVWRDEAVLRGEKAAELAQVEGDHRLEMLRDAEDAARTTKERKEIQLEILHTEQQLALAELNRLLLQPDLLDLDKQIIEAKKAALQATIASGSGEAAIGRANQGPVDAYLAAIPRTGAEINEELERVQAEGLQGLEDGLTGIITGTEGVAEAFSKMADSIIKDLIRIAVKQAIVAGISALFGGGYNMSDAGGVIAANPGTFAAGGTPPVGRASIVGERGPELFVPSTSGTIIPNSDIVKMSSAQQAPNVTSLTVNAPGATAETVAMIRRELAQAAPLIIAAAERKTTSTLHRPRL